MIFIVNHPFQNGGTYTWYLNFTKHLESIKIPYKGIFNKIPHTTDFGERNVIIVNNYLLPNFWDNNILDFIKINKKNKLYFVIHSGICPSNFVISKSIKYIDGFICVSDEIANKVSNIYPTKKIIVFENYVETFEIKHDKKESGIINIHYIGRFTPEKNLPMLFCAMTSVDKSIHLHLFGKYEDKQYQKFLENLVNICGIKDNVHFEEFTDNKHKLYENADYTILTSVHEGMPYCILESLACGVPVITNFNIGDNDGILFKLNGLNEKKYINQLDIFSYDELLVAIGYYKMAIQVSKLKNSDLCKNIGMLIRHPVEKVVIPPIAIKEEGKLFNENVAIIKNAIMLGFERKMKILPKSKYTTEEYQKKLLNIINSL